MLSAIQKKSYGSAEVFWLNRGLLLNRLKRIARKIIAERRNAKRVILFGSMAENKATAFSDADILIVAAHSKERFIDRPADYLKYFQDIGVGIDIFVYTQDEVGSALKEGNGFLTRALSGIALA